jgi:hypothetical protein
MGLLQPARTHFAQAFSGAYRGAFSAAFAGATLSAVCGVAVWFVLGRLTTMPGPFEPYDGGFFCGSIAGFILGFFAGSILGGTGRLKHLSWTAVGNWLFPKHL